MIGATRWRRSRSKECAEYSHGRRVSILPAALSRILRDLYLCKGSFLPVGEMSLFQLVIAKKHNKTPLGFVPIRATHEAAIHAGG